VNESVSEPCFRQVLPSATLASWMDTFGVLGWHRMATQWMRVAFAIAPVGVRSLRLVGSSLALVYKPVQDVADLFGIHLTP